MGSAMETEPSLKQAEKNLSFIPFSMLTVLQCVSKIMCISDLKLPFQLEVILFKKMSKEILS